MVRPNSPMVEIDELITICIAGFEPDAVQVRLTASGTTVEVTVQGPGPKGWTFRPMAADPVGDYSISATQGSRTATGAITVLLPRSLVIEALNPKGGPGGGDPEFDGGTGLRAGNLRRLLPAEG